MTEKPQDDLQQIAASESRMSLLREFWLFLMQEKKWWLLPILVILLLASLLLLLGTTGAAPFIYTLF
jgi:hypothetical protein